MYTEKKYHTRHIHNKALSVHQSNETANSSFKPRPIFVVIFSDYMSVHVTATAHQMWKKWHYFMVFYVHVP